MELKPEHTPVYYIHREVKKGRGQNPLWTVTADPSNLLDLKL